MGSSVLNQKVPGKPGPISHHTYGEGLWDGAGAQDNDYTLSHTCERELKNNILLLIFERERK